MWFRRTGTLPDCFVYIYSRACTARTWHHVTLTCVVVRFRMEVWKSPHWYPILWHIIPYHTSPHQTRPDHARPYEITPDHIARYQTRTAACQIARPGVFFTALSISILLLSSISSLCLLLYIYIYIYILHYYYYFWGVGTEKRRRGAVLGRSAAFGSLEGPHGIFASGHSPVVRCPPEVRSGVFACLRRLNGIRRERGVLRVGF